MSAFRTRPLAIASVVIAVAGLLAALRGLRSDSGGTEPPPQARIVRIDRSSSASIERRATAGSARKNGSHRKSPATSRADSAAPTLTVRGRVMGTGRAGISEAKVWLSVQSDGTSKTEEHVIGETVGDIRGNYKIRCLEMPTEVILSAYKPGFATGATVLHPPRPKPGERHSQILTSDIVLIRAAYLRGRVVDKEGKPLPGASVSVAHVSEAYTTSEAGGSLVSVQTWTAQTNDAGLFAFDEIPAGGLSAEASLDGYIPQHLKVTAPAAGVSFALDARGGDVAGYVLPLGGGAGISSATVQLSMAVGPGPAGGNRRVWNAITNDLGAFSFSGLPEGTYDVSAWQDYLRLAARDPMQGNRIEVSVAKPIQDLKLYLYPGHTLTGKVTDGNRPIEGVEITALCDPPRTDTTGADGTYVLRGVGPGSAGYWLPVRLRKAGYVATDLASQDGEIIDTVLLDPHHLDQARDYTLHKLLTVAGRVLTELGTGIPSATVGSEYSDKQTGTDALGRYVLTVRPQGDATIWATAPGYGRGRSPSLDLDGLSTSGVDIVLKAAAQLEGIVVNERELPVAGAVVQVVQLDGKNAFGGTPIETLQSATDGSFAVQGLPSSYIGITATAGGYVRSEMARIPMSPGETRRDIKLVLRSSRFLGGVVIGLDGKPAEGLRVFATSPDFREWFGASWTDQEGRFRMENIGLDRVTVSIPDPENQPEVLNDVETNRDDLVIKLTPKTPVTYIGRVIDSQTSEPVAEFGVSTSVPKIELRKEGPGLFTAHGFVRGMAYRFMIKAPGYVSPVMSPVNRIPSGRDVVEETFVLHR